MAKVLCMFALASVAAGAPSPAAIRVSPVQEQDNVISNILLSLQPTIETAIAKALGQSAFTSVSVQETVGPVEFAGSLGNTNYQGSFESEQSSFSSSYDSNSGNDGNTIQSAGINGVVYHDTGAPHQHPGNQGSVYHDTGAPHQHPGNQQNFAAAQFSAANSGLSQGFTQQVQEEVSVAHNSASKQGGSTIQSAGINGVVYHDTGAPHQHPGNQGSVYHDTGAPHQHPGNQQNFAAAQFSAANSGLSQGFTKQVQKEVSVAHNSATKNGGSTIQSAGINGVVYHETGTPHQHPGNQQNFAAAQFSAGNSGLSQGFTQQVQKEVSVAQNSASKQGGSTIQSAGINGVVYHDTGAPHQHTGNQQQSISSAQFSVTNGGSQGSFAGAQQEQIYKEATVSASKQQQLVQGVLSALIPGVEAAVQSALLNVQQSSLSSSSTSFSAGSQQTAAVSSQASDVTASQQVSGSSSQQINAAEEQTIVMRIIEVLTPAITTSVRKALASRVQTVQTVAVPVAITATQQNGAAQQESSFGATSSSQLNSQSNQESSASSTSSANYSNLVSQIVLALRPSIALSVQEALDAQRALSTQAFNAAQNSQLSSSAINSQAANSGFIAQQESSSSSSSSGISSDSLANIFGSGGVHTVKIETPSYNIEYNNK